MSAVWKLRAWLAFQFIATNGLFSLLEVVSAVVTKTAPTPHDFTQNMVLALVVLYIFNQKPEKK